MIFERQKKTVIKKLISFANIGRKKPLLKRTDIKGELVHKKKLSANKICLQVGSSYQIFCRTLGCFYIFLKAETTFMDFLHQIKLSFLFYWRTFRFIDTHNLWKLLIMPAIINLIIAILIIVFAVKTSSIIVEYVLVNFQPTSPDRVVHSFIEGLILVMIRAFVFFLYLKIYRYFALILLAPLFAFISSKVQTIATGQSGTNCTSKYILNCTRGVRIAVRNFLIEIILSTLIVVITFLIGWILPLAPIAILLLESYFMGYSMADYRNEQFNISARESRKLINKYSGAVIGNGLIFNFFLLVPLLGVLFAPVFALIASGLSINYLEKRKRILCNSDQSTLSTIKS